VQWADDIRAFNENLSHITHYKYSSGIDIQKECNKQMDKTAK